jgi:hypothetical protein
MAAASAGLAPQPASSPNVIVPSVNGLTRSPDRPSVTYEFDIKKMFRSLIVA